MENQNQPSRPVGRQESSTDPVKEQGILTALTRKERSAAKLWDKRWGFFGQVQQIQEEEALKLGMSLEEYRRGVQSLNCQPAPRQYPVQVDPSPHPLPRVSSGMVGRRATCPLERYGRLVKTARDYPTRPLPPPGQAYDPYKQTIIFLGIDVGDPISYKLPPASSDVTDEMWARPQHVAVTPFSEQVFSAVSNARGY
ncbi:hypothetical protein JYU34_021251 [Plutella xylostella]|uniref:Uncharacterized protein n=2 Tax=Plutella xylostella TaxID=51655 RepID=A0ABQ7PT50_PLUXY|nr:hypothetical protein JYU34_021251 [Plutella xylostella]